MTARYNAALNQLQELSQMEKPRIDTRGIFSDFAEIDRKRMVAYRKHIASLRKLPIQGDHNWLDEDILEEGKDYEVIGGTNLVNGSGAYFAIPIKPVKSEDQDKLYTLAEVRAIKKKAFEDGMQKGWKEAKKKYAAKSQFIITKK